MKKAPCWLETEAEINVDEQYVEQCHSSVLRRYMGTDNDSTGSAMILGMISKIKEENVCWNLGLNQLMMIKYVRSSAIFQQYGKTWGLEVCKVLVIRLSLSSERREIYENRHSNMSCGDRNWG